MGARPDAASADRDRARIYDPIISVEYGRTAKRVLEDAGAEPLYREYPIDHTIDPSFLLEACAWLGGL